MSSELELMANSLFINAVPEMWKAKARICPPYPFSLCLVFSIFSLTLSGTQIVSVFLKSIHLILGTQVCVSVGTVTEVTPPYIHENQPVIFI